VEMVANIGPTRNYLWGGDSIRCEVTATFGFKCPTTVRRLRERRSRRHSGAGTVRMLICRFQRVRICLL
jgi:hypothetical protein